MSAWAYADPVLWEEAMNSNEFPLDEVAMEYSDWVSTDEYSLMKNKETGEIVPLLQSKMGNRTYARKKKLKVREISECMNEISFNGLKFDHGRRCNTRALFFTLEFDSNVVSLQDSWTSTKGVNSVLNQFKSFMKRYFERYGLGKKDKRREIGFSTFSAREAHESGHLHIHMIVLLSTPVPVIYHKKSGSWRLLRYEDTIPLREAWARYVGYSGFLEVQGVVDGYVAEKESPARYSVMSYLMKYMTKAVSPEDTKSIYTHALHKFFNVRDVFSKRFLEDIQLYNIRRDIESNELKHLQQRLKETKSQIKKIESKQNNFGHLISQYPQELDKLYEQKRELERQLKELKPPSKWEYIGRETFTDKKSFAVFYMGLEKHNMEIKEQLIDAMQSVAA